MDACYVYSDTCGWKCDLSLSNTTIAKNNKNNASFLFSKVSDIMTFSIAIFFNNKSSSAYAYHSIAAITTLLTIPINTQERKLKVTADLRDI